jgi:hypothetical protein
MTTDHIYMRLTNPTLLWNGCHRQFLYGLTSRGR